jgi:hypothetical protein
VIVWFSVNGLVLSTKKTNIVYLPWIWTHTQFEHKCIAGLHFFKFCSLFPKVAPTPLE